MPYKKIAILVAGYPPVYKGGTEIATTYIAKYASYEGHDVHVIALDGTSEGEVLYKADNYQIHRIKTIPVPYLYGLVALSSIIAIIRDIKPDIIHAQGSQMGFLALIASKITGIPYMLYGRGEIYVDWFMKSYITKLLMKHAQRVIAQTENMKLELLKYYNRSIEVIPNGIEIERFGTISKQEARKSLRISQDTMVVLAVGKTRPEKNYLQLIEIMKLVGGNVVTMVLGGGQQLEMLRREALMSGRCVLFVGDKDNNQISTYMSAADVFINTSSSEGFPMAVLEAMASGLPILANNVTGMSEIVTNGKNGYLIKPNDIFEAVISMNMLLYGDRTKQMAIDNKKKAREYTWANVVKKLYN